MVMCLQRLAGRYRARLSSCLLVSLMLQSAFAIPIDNGLVAKAVTRAAMTRQVCSSTIAADFVTVIDGSSSIGDDNFRLLANWLADLASELPEGSQFAAVEYSGFPVKLWNLDTYENNADVEDAFRTMRYLTGTTKTGAALQFTIDEGILTQGNRPDVPDIFTLITDGKSQDDAAAVANVIKNMGWQVFAIGIKNAVLEELQLIASDPTSVLILDTFDDLTPETRQALLQTRTVCTTENVAAETIGESAIDLQCNPDSIVVGGDTRNPFEGKVFVRDQSGDSDCISEGDGSESRAELTLGVNTCGTTRRRSVSESDGGRAIEKRSISIKSKGNTFCWVALDPPGVYLENTVVISFHKKFVTKVDRVYKVQCFYMEADKTVETDIQVSKLTTQAEEQQFPMPTCTYTIHRESADGPAVRFALIGESVFHKWECDNTESGDLFKMKVHSCFLADADGTPIELLDDNGCAVDINILNNVEYDDVRLRATVESHVFRLQQQAGEQFQCQVQLCVDLEGGCENIHPTCPDIAPRRRRSVSDGKRPSSSTEHRNTTAVPNIHNQRSTDRFIPELRRSQSVQSEYMQVVAPAELGMSSFNEFEPIYGYDNEYSQSVLSTAFCVSDVALSMLIVILCTLCVLTTSLLTYIALYWTNMSAKELHIKA